MVNRLFIYDGEKDFNFKQREFFGGAAEKAAHRKYDSHHLTYDIIILKIKF